MNLIYSLDCTINLIVKIYKILLFTSNKITNKLKQTITNTVIELLTTRNEELHPTREKIERIEIEEAIRHDLIKYAL